MVEDKLTTGADTRTQSALAEHETTAPLPPDHRRARVGRAILVCVLAAAALSGLRPAYRWWHGHRSKQYQKACGAATGAKSWEQLNAIASQWVAWDPHSSDGWVYLAESCVQRSEVEAAAEALGRVDDAYHGALEALALRGDMLFSDLNRPYEAVETWQRMLRINPQADLARQRLIYFYAMTMQREQMLQHIDRAMELGCEPPEAYAYLLLAYEVTFSDGLRMTGEWLEAHPDDVALNVAHAVYLAKYSPENTVNIYGMSLVAAGDETLVNEYLQKYPNNLELLAYFIDKAVVAGDQQRVLELLRRCGADAERDSRFWRFRGWYLAAQDRFREAADALETGLELYPFDWRARVLLAGVLRRLDRLAEAATQARLADLGKDLHRELFQLPNARSLNPSIVRQIDEYFQLTAPATVRQAWHRRRE